MNLSSPARSIPWTGNRVADTILREMEAHRKRLGAQLLELRKARGWNQEDAAHEVGVGVKTWRLWERGKSLPYDSNVRKLAEVFEIHPDELGVKPAPLGLVDQSPADALADRFDALQQQVTEQLAEHARKVEQLLHDQDALLRRQTELLEKLEAAIQRDTDQAQAVKDETDELRRLAREMIPGRPGAAPSNSQPAPQPPAAAKSPAATGQRTR